MKRLASGLPTGDDTSSDAMLIAPTEADSCLTKSSAAMVDAVPADDAALCITVSPSLAADPPDDAVLPPAGAMSARPLPGRGAMCLSRTGVARRYSTGQHSQRAASERLRVGARVSWLRVAALPNAEMAKAAAEAPHGAAPSGGGLKGSVKACVRVVRDVAFGGVTKTSASLGASVRVRVSGQLVR